MISLYTEQCSYVSKDDIRRYPGIGKIAELLQCIFLVRGDTREKRTEALQKIAKRQELGESGEMPPLLIYPEGCTTNGTSMIKFKKGAFHSLRAVRPMTINYYTGGIQATQDVTGFLNHTLITGLCRYIVIT